MADHYILPYLLWEISRLMFERTGERVHIHGAALVRDERAVVLAGRSHAGKSTLAAWLTFRGWGFLTDEAALVDPDALVVATASAWAAWCRKDRAARVTAWSLGRLSASACPARADLRDDWRAGPVRP